MNRHDTGHVLIRLPRSLKAPEQAKQKLKLLNYVTFTDIQNQIFTLAGYQHLVRGMVTEQRAGSIISKQDEILQKIILSLKFAQIFQDLRLKQPKWQNANHVFLLAISHQDFLTIKHTVSLDELEIFADPLLEQVFQILADNSLTHGKTVTQVTFRYEPGTEAVTLFFEDDGVGIPKDTKDKIFEPDFQKKKGVGLFLTREILDTTGISITETGDPGKGARFELRVPRGMPRRLSSSLAGAVSVIEALNEGADFYLQKGGEPKPQFAELSNKLRYAVMRRLAEDALHESEIRFRELSDLLPQVVYKSDTKGNLTYANQISFERFGYTEDEFRQGLNGMQMLAPSDRERGARVFRQIAEGKGKMRPAEEFLAIRKDGTTFLISIYSTPVFANNRITGTRGIISETGEPGNGA